MAEQEKRENVINGLECCLEGLSDICPYKDSDAPGGCKDELMYDALVLLEAQEPVKPCTKRDGRTTFFLCGGCNKPLCIAKDSYKPKHCPECGRKVKWE